MCNLYSVTKVRAEIVGQQHRRLVLLHLVKRAGPGRTHLKPVWSALAEDRPLAFFAEAHVRNRTCMRKIKTGEKCLGLFGRLTTDAAEQVRPTAPRRCR